MKILFVQPANTTNKNFINSIFKKIKITSIPPLTLQQVAALTPKKYKVELVDDNFEKIPYKKKVDLVGITARTCSVLRAYEIADEFRKYGIPVVLGGYHVSGLPEEALQHADSVIIGDAENTWPQLLDDFEQGHMKKKYVASIPPDPTMIKSPMRNLVCDISITATIQASRGCPHNCEFCALPNITPYGSISRTRPISDMIAEIKGIKQKFIAFLDPSISIQPEYFKKLFTAMIPLKKKFSAYANIDIAYDDEFLELAKKAGFKSLSIGFDSISQETMNTVGKKINKVENYKEVVKKIYDYGFSVIGCFIFGFDTDKPDIFETTSQAISQLDLDCIRVNILTPLPGTPIFHKMDQEKRILTYDWSKYDYQHVVFQPKHMSPNELLEGTKRVIIDFFNMNNITKKILLNLKKDLINKDLNYTAMITSYLISSYIYHQNLVGLNPLIRKLGINEIQV